MIVPRPLPAGAAPAAEGRSLRRASDDARRAAAEILAQVREGGDGAVAALTERFDGARLASSRVDPSEVEAALAGLDPDLAAALREARSHIEAVHTAQRFREEAVEPVRGVRVWREWRPLRRVGLYVPGGRAAYPSTVLMLAVPARLAGCREVVLCTPPGKEGRVAAAVLAAAALAGVTEVHAVGGVQAVGAMAYGTESIRPVDKIFGPGNRYVTAAKLLVFGEVAVDMPAGPSEVVVVAGPGAPAEWVAADLRAQAEHAPDALAVLVTPDAGLAGEVAGRLQDIAAQVSVHVAPDLESAVRFADGFAPEHLILAFEGAEAALPEVSRAGSVFLGLTSPAAAGDYATGANHVLPTGGAGAAFGALGLADFGRVLQVQSVSAQGLDRLRRIVAALAAAEGMPAHAESVRVRCQGGGGEDAWRPSARSAIRHLEPYAWEPPSRAIAAAAGIEEGQVVRFDTNTSPWAGVEVAAARPLAPINEYPDSSYEELVSALARYAGVAARAVTVGAGADEVLDLIAKAFVGPGDLVVTSLPSYSMFRVVAEMAGGRVLGVPAGPRLATDRKALARAAAGARVTFVCNPNNPTGELLDQGFIEALAAGSSGVVVVDEAYFEFGGLTLAPLVASVPNLAVVRTMSKAFGLAGARVGCAFSSPAVATALRAVRPPGSVSSLSAALAVRALEDRPSMEAHVAAIVKERESMAGELRSLGLGCRGGAGNFLLAEAAPAAPALLARGLAVRTFSAGSPLQGWIRVTVRTPEENARLLRALSSWRASSDC
ncbi:MAG: histidinol dehydrogenase [Candidatus Dormibacterales bacterium]